MRIVDVNVVIDTLELRRSRGVVWTHRGGQQILIGERMNE